MKQVTLKLPDQLHRQSKQLSAERGIPDYSTFVREAIRHECGRGELNRIEERIANALRAQSERFEIIERMMEKLYQLMAGTASTSQPMAEAREQIYADQVRSRLRGAQ